MGVARSRAGGVSLVVCGDGNGVGLDADALHGLVCQRHLFDVLVGDRLDRGRDDGVVAGLVAAASEHHASPRAAGLTTTAILRPQPRMGLPPCLRMKHLLMPGPRRIRAGTWKLSAAAGPPTPRRRLAAVRKYRPGRTRRFASAVVTNPPRMIGARGLRISRTEKLP